MTHEEAFRTGQTIADRITELNPKPVKLRFEKVRTSAPAHRARAAHTLLTNATVAFQRRSPRQLYHPCMMLTKKRYVGFKYESPTETTPAFDAKGIETVRRDGCPAVSKMLERSIKMLFRTQNLSEIKAYLQRQWRQILAGRVAIPDFIFAKEVRLGTYSAKGPLPPAAMVAAQRLSTDPRAEPRYGERVRYVVVYGGPRSRLIDLVVPPEQLLKDRYASPRPRTTA